MPIQTSDKNRSSIIKADYDLITANQHTFINTLSEKSTVVDLGGNLGGFSKLIFNLFECNCVVTMEGNPALIPIIKKNLWDHSAHSEVVHALIGPEYSEGVDFHICENPEASLVNRSLNKGQKVVETVSVKMLTLDYIYQRVPNEKIDLLKVDIEGMEWEILIQLTKADYEKIDQISVEFHDFLDAANKPKTIATIKHLESLGYRYVKGKYESDSAYYDTLFCKPELYDKHIKAVNEQQTGSNWELKHEYIKSVENAAYFEYQTSKEIVNLYNSLSWKITAPLRTVASWIGIK